MLDICLIGKRIKELRKAKGLTQNAFADEIHVSFQAVSNWERGIAPPELENLIRIASYFGILIDELLRAENEDFFLGIDGGGTKTEFAVVSSGGNVVKRLIKSGCNPNDIGYSKMFSLLNAGIDEVLLEYPSVKSVFLGIAGITTGNHAERLCSELKKCYPRLKTQIKSDTFNLFAMKEEAGMAIISGTGSVVFIKKGDKYKRLGGWGYLLDNAGSAYDIGRDALREALFEEDMNQKPSLLGNMLRKKLNTTTVWEHINTIYSEGKPYIAELATVVFEAYRLGDKTAMQIIDNNAKALANLLNMGVELYGADPIAIASGGLFTHYTDIMTECIKKHSGVELIIGELPPIYGACISARLMESSEISDNFYNNFKNTYGRVEK